MENLTVGESPGVDLHPKLLYEKNSYWRSIGKHIRQVIWFKNNTKKLERCNSSSSVQEGK